MSRLADQVTALAGIFQAAELARQVARRGLAESDAMEHSIYSLFQVDAESVPAVYRGLAGVTLGLRTLRRQLGSTEQREAEVTRYVIALLHLERKLAKRQDLTEQIGERIGTTTNRLEHYPMLHENILAGLADIYAATISTLTPRIMIQGEQLHLQNPDNVNRIRALLLAGIRSAMLWRQCGGSRLQLFLGRRKLMQVAQSILEPG